MDTTLPQAFVWRRLHSLMGLWLVLFLSEHLLVNSQAALWLGDSGSGFIELVNSIHNLPYLQVLEILLLGVPIAIHAAYGIKYARESKPNSRKSDGSSPSLSFRKNKAYTWQRITSWFLLFAILFHVIQFRWMNYPSKVRNVDKVNYIVPLNLDSGLYTLSSRLNVTLYDKKKVDLEKAALSKRSAEKALRAAAEELQDKSIFPKAESYNGQTSLLFQTAQSYEMKTEFIDALESYSLKEGQVLAICPDFGSASLLSVRDHFKNPFYLIFYTLFVLAAVFHAFNGFWTFLITWGVVLKVSAQKMMARFSVGLMILLAFLGLAAVWGTYWINLKS